MNYFFEVITLIVLFALYGFIHSVLASEKVKILFRKIFGKFIAFYRLGYNVFALIGLYFIWDLAPQPSLQIYQLSSPFDYLVLIPQFLALAGMIWCFKYISFKEFVGLNQFDRYLKNEISDSNLDEKYTLRIEGPYKYSRHPVYFFSIIFLMFRAEMNLSYLTMFMSFTAYFYIGSYYEEKKLVRLFGDVYKDYQKNVPRIFPYKIR
ncbi:MAG: isoprenylcysteine carboxylmethyltransferase family protein [Ignavibacteriaceae bacterium]